ncbi:hypothetical protein BZA05DRAFT_416252 [Tricharina praecox]|uniref:uncharacterized protein n=1 Tax=Tricharina praecox TaxID=43433 RepID=UPI00221F4965|nr:uncharacterized protein BZA05DRAFT_416252 [Tricharina praecox]KAI5856597.1 hypothetical protein BZA05DRAFT_416252 [Tricharina praecox]
MATDKTVYASKWGTINKLTELNYPKWKNDLSLVLTAMDALEIVAGEEEEQPPAGNSVAARAAQVNYRKRQANDAKAMRFSCSDATPARSPERDEQDEVQEKSLGDANLGATSGNEAYSKSGKGGKQRQSQPPSKWILDFGASQDIYNGSPNMFTSYNRLMNPIEIKLSDDSCILATHYGSLLVQNHPIEALHTPTIRISLFSVGEFDSRGHSTLFVNGYCTITSPGS